MYKYLRILWNSAIHSQVRSIKIKAKPILDLIAFKFHISHLAKMGNSVYERLVWGYYNLLG